MAFLFGIDVPIVEILAVLALLIIIALTFVLVGLRRTKSTNEKLDHLLRDEHKIKKELHMTKLEEDEQLLLMMEMIKQLSLLTGAKAEGKKAIREAKRLAGKAQTVSARKAPDYISKMEMTLNKLEEITEEEDKQLTRIKDILRKVKK